MEEWKDIKGYKGFYQVSNLGRVRSLDRLVKSKPPEMRMMKGRILKNGISSGYFSLSLSKDGKTSTHLLHRLVAIAFLENPEGKRTVNHIDGNKKNNELSNLEWATHQENIQHSWENGFSKSLSGSINEKLQGENNYNSKLTEESVKAIRKLSRKNGGAATDRELAKKFNIKPSTVRDVLTFKSWKHVGNPETVNKDFILSKTGYKNVFKDRNRFRGGFKYEGKMYYCGSHDTPEEAYEAVNKKRGEMKF